MPDLVRKVESGTQRKDTAHRLSDEINRAIDAVDDESVQVVEAVYISAADVEAVHSLSAELGKQRGMRVQNAAVKAGQSSGADLLHVACKDDDIHGVLDQYAADRSVQRLGFRMR